MCSHTLTHYLPFYTCEKLTVNAYTFMHIYARSLTYHNIQSARMIELAWIFDVFLHTNTCLYRLLGLSFTHLHAHPCLIACNNWCSRIFFTVLHSTLLLFNNFFLWFGKISSAWHIAIVFSVVLLLLTVQFKSIHISKLIVCCTRHFLTVPIIFTRPHFV